MINPVQYSIRTMTDAEKNYYTSEKESLAVIFSLSKFRVFLLSSIPFKLITYHQDLLFDIKKNDFH